MDATDDTPSIEAETRPERAGRPSGAVLTPPLGFALVGIVLLVVYGLWSLGARPLDQRTGNEPFAETGTGEPSSDAGSPLAGRSPLAERRLADAAEGLWRAGYSMTVATYLQLALGAVGVFLIWRTLAATRETLHEATLVTDAALRSASAAESAERAWVFPEFVVNASDEERHALDLNVANYGRTPARNVRLTYTVFAGGKRVSGHFETMAALSAGKSRSVRLPGVNARGLESLVSGGGTYRIEAYLTYQTVLERRVRHHVRACCQFLAVKDSGSDRVDYRWRIFDGRHSNHPEARERDAA